MGLGQKPPDKKPPNNEKYMLMFFVSLFNCSYMKTKMWFI